MATIAGLIFGPHCLGWLDPASWGNTDEITLEICRIVLCIQIVAVAVELPRKYMKKHWLSVAILLLPVMTCGWLIVGLFIWVLIPHFNFALGLLVAACVTATDPVLAAAVVGKGKFAERVPGHLRNLLTAESGCNDGMAFPFIFLSLDLIIHHGHAGEIVKDWFTLTILWECAFGVVLGVVLGYTLRKALVFAEKHALIDRESFLALFVFLAFNCAGIGSMLGVDDLLVSFAAGTAFGWNGDFARKTEELHVSTVIDLLLNLSFFVYFGLIVPWPEFNNAALGLNVWRLIVLAVVIVFLRRIPAVLLLKPFTPDIKLWREALFCGHFGPIGVGAIFAAILARAELEGHYTSEEVPLSHLPLPSFPHYQLIATIWPIVCFVVITSIIVHGSSVAVLTLGKRLNRMAITMSFTVTNTQDQGPSWMSRLQKLDRTSSSYSLHRIDTLVPDDHTLTAHDTMTRSSTIETSGVKVRPAGGARRKRLRKSRLHKTLSRSDADGDARQRPEAPILQLGRAKDSSSDDEKVLEKLADADVHAVAESKPESEESGQVEVEQARKAGKAKHPTTLSIPAISGPLSGSTVAVEFSPGVSEATMREVEDTVSQHMGAMRKDAHITNVPTTAYQEGLHVIIEDQDGEIIETVSVLSQPRSDKWRMGRVASGSSNVLGGSEGSIHSMESLQRNMSIALDLNESHSSHTLIARKLSRHLTGPVRRAIVKKGTHKRYYAHQVDNLILVENEDGEIVRRYRVNKHDTPKTRSRSSTLMSRALSMVGIRSSDQMAERDSAPAPVEHAIVHEALEEDASDLEEQMELEVSDVSDEETQVERRRRLAALGQIPDGRGDSDEEE